MKYFLKEYSSWADAAQGWTCFCCCSSALLTNVYLVVHQDPRPFQQGCSSATQILTCSGLFGYFVPGAGLYIFLNIILFLLAHSSNLPKFLCSMAHPSDAFTSPPSLVSLANLLRVLLIPSSN